MTSKHYPGFLVRSSSWNTIIECLQDYRPATARFVEWLRDSEYAFGLFAITSLDTLIIGQSHEFDMWRNVIRIKENGERFTITFYESDKSASERECDEEELIPAFQSSSHP